MRCAEASIRERGFMSSHAASGPRRFQAVALFLRLFPVLFGLAVEGGKQGLGFRT